MANVHFCQPGLYHLLSTIKYPYLTLDLCLLSKYGALEVESKERRERKYHTFL
jgi:hypothetical protein